MVRVVMILSVVSLLNLARAGYIVSAVGDSSNATVTEENTTKFGDDGILAVTETRSVIRRAIPKAEKLNVVKPEAAKFLAAVPMRRAARTHGDKSSLLAAWDASDAATASDKEEMLVTGAGEMEASEPEKASIIRRGAKRANYSGVVDSGFGASIIRRAIPRITTASRVEDASQDASQDGTKAAFIQIDQKGMMVRRAKTTQKTERPRIGSRDRRKADEAAAFAVEGM